MNSELPSDTKSSEHSYNTILVAEDDPIFRRVLASWLEKWGYKISLAEDGSQAWEFLQQETAPKLLLLDWMMPGMDGPELCRRIRERRSTPYQYVVLITARDDKQDVVNGLDAGADDYLTKPFDNSELRARLRVGERILALQDELIEAREGLRFQATHDPLTGIWNRGAVLDLLHREFQRSLRSGESLGVLMLDVDHFKNINDSHGHLTGDIVLKQVVERITQVVRPYDFVGRYGGEEFLVVLPGCGADHLRDIAERIRLSLSTAPVCAGMATVPVTASIGAALAFPRTGVEDEILKTADAAVYRAKKAGRNRTEVLL